MKRPLVCFLFLIFIPLVLYPQTNLTEASEVFVDGEGVLRWKGSNEEVSLFGVNYTTPFAYSFRAHKRLGLSLKKAIDLDVEQMARLGFDAFRIHVWDREISDADGNLLQNEHLDLFDYLLAKLAEHNIKSIVTPIAWWGNGWPEPDETTPGFSQTYPRIELITNAKAREAERNYIRQLITHTNPYRRISYKNDPSIIAVEIINEPTHPDNGQEVTDYINEMVGVLRSIGFAKPIFYNISQNWSNVQADAVTKSEVDGISFQWYPTDLVHQTMLRGNYLLHVNKYTIPSENVAGYSMKAKMVYEFDAADVGGSYMYPAMVRSFREAGMQFATMFSYDPTQIAWSNTEYPTHFMNLMYTPSKALSLMIAGKAFHKLRRNTSFGSYPANSQFGDFRVSYEEDLSEMNSDTEFIYSNATSTMPKKSALLQRIAGCGNSPIIQYDGTGAYFLERIESGIWKLEIYPDVLWLQDPFETTSMSQQVARLFWNQRQMKINLPDLGNEYILYPLSEIKSKNENSYGTGQLLRPGKYLVSAKPIDKRYLRKYLSKEKESLEGLYIPPPIAPNIYVVNNTNRYSNEMNPSAFKFQIASEQPVVHATLFIRRLGWRGFAEYPLKYLGGFNYVVADSPKFLQSGNLEYCVAVESKGKEYTFPGGVQSTPGKWDFTTSNYWSLKILDMNEQVVLLDVSRDRKDFVFPQFDRTRRYNIEFKNGTKSDETSLALKITTSGNPNASFGFQLNVHDKVKPFAQYLGEYKTVVIKARADQDSSMNIGLNMIQYDGVSFGTTVKLKPVWQEIEILISSLRPCDALLLPNSYPLFLPKIWKNQKDSSNPTIDLRLLNGLQVTIDRETEAMDMIDQSIEIESVYLKK